jgi:sensor histidine kinase regulating citrate/malate metabolism
MYFSNKIIENINNQFTERVDKSSAYLGLGLNLSLGTGNMMGAKDTTDYFKKDDELAFIYIFDEENEFFIKIKDPKEYNIGEKTLLSFKDGEIAEMNDVIIKRIRLEYDNEFLGTAFIAYKTQSRSEHINDIVIKSIVIIIILILLNIFITYIVVKKVIKHPLDLMTERIKLLAERTQKSLAEINATINLVVQSIIDSSENMNSNVDLINRLHELSNSVEEEINETVDIVHKATSASESNLKDTQKMTQDTDKMIELVNIANKSVSENMINIEDVADASREIDTLSYKLNSKLESFKTS